MLNTGRFLLIENTKVLESKYTLIRALKKSDIALICVLFECPYCKSDIWTRVGQHTGDGGTEDCIVRDMCYECCQSYKIHTMKIEIKDTAFFTPEEYNNFNYKRFVINFKNLQNKNTYKKKL
jgi:hypothetical protein